MSKKLDQQFNSVIMTIRVPKNLYETAQASARDSQMSLAEWIRHKMRNILDSEKGGVKSV
jgi:predicted HicB family RNase H-like nuclease